MTRTSDEFGNIQINSEYVLSRFGASTGSATGGLAGGGAGAVLGEDDAEDGDYDSEPLEEG